MENLKKPRIFESFGNLDIFYEFEQILENFEFIIKKSKKNWNKLNNFLHISEVESFERIKQRDVTIAKILGGNLRHEKQLVDISDDHKQVEAEIS